MADKRINALTTTSASVGDDYFAIDGATNGTRALSAFSPTFGGNATVTGTLTVNTSGSVFNTRLFINSAARNQTLTDGTAITGSNSADDLALRNDSGKIYLSAGGAVPQFTLTTTALTLSSTTASTSTSSGALVVSGGVGVAGAGNFGGAVGVGGATVASRLHVYESTSGTGDSNGITIEQASTADAALQFLLTGVQRWTVGIDNSDSDKFKIGTGAIGSADRLTIDTSGNLSIPATTASTSTSSGALVVSGGVGVAGAIYAGGNIVNTGVLSATSSATTLTNVLSNTLTAATNVLNLQLRRGDSANGFARLMLNTSTTTEWSFGTRAADTNLYIWDEVANAARLTVASSDGLATFGAAIRTSAPSGGTAANWKLGTVATVSPTSPNRTIEVDIGGTIYYIHAKTTNN